jgi:hypothetical protein
MIFKYFGFISLIKKQCRLFIGDIPLEPIRWVALSLVIAVLGVVIIQNELQGFNDLGPMSVAGGVIDKKC